MLYALLNSAQSIMTVNKTLFMTANKTPFMTVSLVRGKFVAKAITHSMIIMCIATAVINPSYATQTSTELSVLESPVIVALREATRDIIEPTQQIETLTWLSEMSRNIEKRVPDDFYRIRLVQTVLEEANRVDVDPQLVLAVMAIESNFNRYAESGAGAQGLMQVMPFWKKELGSENDDLFNPRVNIRYGSKILKHYLDRYSPSIPRALAAYNGSLGRSFYYEKVLKRLEKSWGFKAVYSLKSPDNDTDKAIAANDINK